MLNIVLSLLTVCTNDQLRELDDTLARVGIFKHRLHSAKDSHVSFEVKYLMLLYLPYLLVLKHAILEVPLCRLHLRNLLVEFLLLLVILFFSLPYLLIDLIPDLYLQQVLHLLDLPLSLKLQQLLLLLLLLNLLFQLLLGSKLLLKLLLLLFVVDRGPLALTLPVL